MAIHPHDEHEFKTLLKKYHIHKVVKFVPGGKERQHSIYNALKTVDDDGIILVHDAARPFIQKKHIHLLTKQRNKPVLPLLVFRQKIQ